MVKRLEFEGKTVDHAVDEACVSVGIPREKLKFDVLSYGSTGIFGLVGSKRARIRVKLPDASRMEVKGETEEPKPPQHPEPALADPPKAEIPEPEANRAQEEADAALVAMGKEALERMLDSITEDTVIGVELNSGRVLYNVKGGNSGLLIGKRGQTLDALQYLVDKIVNKNTDNRFRVRVDVEEYQKNRRIHLERVAEEMSQKVKRTGKAATLGEMNAADRRIVHLALKDDPDVRTQSKGGGVLKKLSILPRKKPSPKK